MVFLHTLSLSLFFVNYVEYNKLTCYTYHFPSFFLCLYRKKKVQLANCIAVTFSPSLVFLFPYNKKKNINSSKYVNSIIVYIKF